MDKKHKDYFLETFQHRQRPSDDEIFQQSYYQDEGAKLKELLSSKSPKELSIQDLKNVVEGNLWMLAPDTYLYFLPAFLNAALYSYNDISVLVSELIDSLTKPSRSDILDSFDMLEKNQGNLGLSEDIIKYTKEQQAEWFDSGTPEALFHNRFVRITNEEGGAVLSFLNDLKEQHGKDFPFNEFDIAIERFWGKYKNI